MKINFLLADEFRPEMGGKNMALGLYADYTILLEPNEEPEAAASDLPIGIDRLAFLVNVSDMIEGPHQFKAQIVDPSGKAIGPEVSLGEAVEIQKDASRSFVLTVKPFLVDGKGTYHFNFYVDGAMSALPFHIIDRPLNV